MRGAAGTTHFSPSRKFFWSSPQKKRRTRRFSHATGPLSCASPPQRFELRAMNRTRGLCPALTSPRRLFRATHPAAAFIFSSAGPPWAPTGPQAGGNPAESRKETFGLFPCKAARGVDLWAGCGPAAAGSAAAAGRAAIGGARFANSRLA